MRLDVLDAVDDIQTLDTATENGVLVVKPWLFSRLASNTYYEGKSLDSELTVFSVVMKN